MSDKDKLQYEPYSFEIVAGVWGNFVTYKLYIFKGNLNVALTWPLPPVFADFLNFYIKNFSFTTYNIFQAELPSNAMKALRYGNIIRTVTLDELKQIVKTNITPLETWLSNIGAPADFDAIHKNGLQHVHGQYVLGLENYPKVSVTFTSAGNKASVTFDAKTVDSVYIKDKLATAPPLEWWLLSIFSNKTQMKHVTLLSQGKEDIDYLFSLLEKIKLSALNKQIHNILPVFKGTPYELRLKKIATKSALCQ
ncbi:MAG: hypothetical protein NWF09_07625 [Candidatus Bathyarchaeota archaeon]|nr:hypothetical protein [Candidatus Bathyarchaeota archaeon]